MLGGAMGADDGAVQADGLSFGGVYSKQPVADGSN